MTTDPFEAYRLPKGVAEGTEINLAGTPAVFTVSLPSRTNEDFTMKLLTRLSTKGVDVSDGINVVQMQVERKTLFLEECVLDAKGLPDGMTTQMFFKEYPLAAKLLFERAQELAAEADDEVDQAMEKLLPTQNGPRSGAGDKSNMKTSSKRGSSRGPKDQKSAA